MSKLLLLEDDLSLIDGLTYSLKKQGYETDVARTVREAYALLWDTEYDLLILDVSLPDGSGFDVCKNVRRGANVPILFLTASDEELNVTMGLDIGGDDYMTKPFKLSILSSKINALLRRSKDFAPADTELASNGITVNLLQGRAFKDGETLELTAAEYRLLCIFMRNPGILLTKETILERLWDGNGNYVDDNTLAVYIRRLRMKIEAEPGSPEMLTTVRGMGYRWNTINGGTRA